MGEWEDRAISQIIDHYQRSGSKLDWSDAMAKDVSITLNVPLARARAIVNARLHPLPSYGGATPESYTQRLQSAAELKRQAIISAGLYAQSLGMTPEEYTAAVPEFPLFPGPSYSFGDLAPIYAGRTSLLNYGSLYGFRQLLSEGTRIPWTEQARLSGVVVEVQDLDATNDPKHYLRVPMAKPVSSFTSWVGIIPAHSPYSYWGMLDATRSTTARSTTIEECIAYTNMYPNVIAQVGGQLSLPGLRRGNVVPYLDCLSKPFVLSSYNANDPNVRSHPSLVSKR